MTISNQPASLLDSILTAQTTREDLGVAVLKKAQDSAKLVHARRKADDFGGDVVD